jgi:hypothetical protein
MLAPGGCRKTRAMILKCNKSCRILNDSLPPWILEGTADFSQLMFVYAQAAHDLRNVSQQNPLSA